jgi:polygalacturonase
MSASRRTLIRATAALACGAAAGVLLPRPPAAQDRAGAEHGIDVRALGATGDGRTIDTPAINRAIALAAQAGGGVVRFPAGTYRCFSIRLQSFVSLVLDPGAVILAAEVPREGTTSGGYDAAEPNGPWEQYQDFGHNHWHNSLIWGDGLQDVAILGPGLIWGKGLARGIAGPTLPLAERPGVGNKAIALKNCRNVILRDFAILAGGHFGILATGVDNLTIDNLRIDTNRDGMNVDCCRNVRIGNCSVNAPHDDAICLKSSFALGEARPTENVTISDCYVTGGYAVGTLLDGSFRRIEQEGTGRIKLGTESIGGFRNVAITNCVFESSRGLALECVDGGALEDVSIVGVTMRDVRTAPLFLRLGVRLRGPAGTLPGTLRRVKIAGITCHGPASDLPAIVSGIPGHFIEDVTIEDVSIEQEGGGTAAWAALQPPELPSAYPEPIMFGQLPATGFLIRHARNLSFGNVEITVGTPDARPAFWLDDVDGADFFRIRAPQRDGVPAFRLRDVSAFRLFGSRGLPDTTLPYAADRDL